MDNYTSTLSIAGEYDVWEAITDTVPWESRHYVETVLGIGFMIRTSQTAGGQYKRAIMGDVRDGRG